MNHVFHRTLGDTLPVAARGDGIHIIDRDGKRYIDASGGAAVSCLGHSDLDVRRAIIEQTEKLSFAHTSFFTTDVAEELADGLIARAPAGLDRVFYVSGGSEAIEACLKLARQYFFETGAIERRHIIARRQSYHGITLGALAAGGHAWRSEPFQPMLFSARHIAPCYAYREQSSNEPDEAYGLRAADQLEAAIQDLGPESVAAFVAEPVVGATMGAVPPAPGYLRRIREICDRHGVLLIFDEVMCGMGRTGTLHACEQDGIAPDLMAIAKGFGAGYQPIGAALVSARVYDAFANGSGSFRHSHTYSGHAIACAAALAVQRVIETRGLLANVGARGDELRRALDDRFAENPHVGDIRGRGLFLGVELVADRETKQTFDPALKLHARIKREAMVRGLMCYPAGGTADGTRGDHVLLAPPFIVGPDDVDQIVERLGAAVDAAVASTGYGAH
jgi:adenosylmethionine-8-amino-7-oxononanoate aminotransferase